MEDDPDVFAALVTRTERGVVTHFIPVPTDIAERYVAARSRRVIATLNGEEVRRYLFQTADGEFGIVVGKSVLRDLGIPMHEPVIVELRPDPDPDRVDIPEELVAALDQDEAAASRFYDMTPGKQRGLSGYVDQAKRPATRVKRAVEIAEKLRTYTLHGDRKE